MSQSLEMKACPVKRHDRKVRKRCRFSVRRLLSGCCLLVGFVLLFGRTYYHLEAVHTEKELKLPDAEIVDDLQPDSELTKLLRKLFRNKHCVAYLYCTDMKKGYSVMQGKDNGQYLYRNTKGQYSINGSIFLDADNVSDFTDTASVIYGHNMLDGSMFGNLEKFYQGKRKNGDFRTFKIYTRESVFTYQCFANTKIHGVDQKVFHVDGGETIPEFFQMLQARAYWFDDSLLDVSGFQDREAERQTQLKTLSQEFLEESLSQDVDQDLEQAVLDAKDRANAQVQSEFLEPLLSKRVVTLTTCHQHVDRFGVTGVLMKEKQIGKQLYP